MKQFIKKDNLQLLNGGYLSNKEGNPVNNEEFYKAQKRAEYVITLLSELKGKDFKGKKADSLEDIKKLVTEKLNKQEKVTFLPEPSKIETPTLDKLADEAMSFIKNNENKSNVEKLNAFLQEFVILKEFEDFGLFFTDEIVKLNKIYTVNDLIEAFKTQESVNLI